MDKTPVFPLNPQTTTCGQTGVAIRPADRAPCSGAMAADGAPAPPVSAGRRRGNMSGPVQGALAAPSFAMRTAPNPALRAALGPVLRPAPHPTPRLAPHRSRRPAFRPAPAAPGRRR